MKIINKGFTFIEILVGLSVSAAIFIVATSLMANIFTTTTKSRQLQILEQVKNDLQAEFGNSVRWADSVSFVGGVLQIDADNYLLDSGVLLKNGSTITPDGVEVTRFEVKKHDSPSGVNTTANSGTGLTGQYFNTRDLTELAFTQTDYLVDFDWRAGSPDPLIDDNTFSIRYSGQVEAPIRSDYIFYVHSDDGARLWINNNLVINDWGVPGYGQSNTASIPLNAGEKYDIRLEYNENFGNAELSLYWSYFGVSKQIIPTSRLYPNQNYGSVEIEVDLQNRNSPSIVDTMRLILSPRSGNIGVVE